MRFLYSLIFSLILSTSVVIYHYNTIDTNIKSQEISKLSTELKLFPSFNQFRSKEFKEFTYE